MFNHVGGFERAMIRTVLKFHLDFSLLISQTITKHCPNDWTIKYLVITQ